MGTGTISKQKEVESVSGKAKLNKPSPIQVSQTIECLKGLEDLLDNYEELHEDANLDLKQLLDFVETRKSISE